MLFDPSILWNDTLAVLAVLFIIMVGKSLVTFVVVRSLHHSLSTALMITAALGQIGEFSFILAGLGVELNLLPERGRDLILAGAILSILFNPITFLVNDWLVKHFAKHEEKPEEAETEEEAPLHATALVGHAILVGYGRVGSFVGRVLEDRKEPYLVIEDGDKHVAQLRHDGIEVLAGNAVRENVLLAANVAGARRMFIAIPNCFEAGQVIEQARAVNPHIEIVARAHSDAEVEYLEGLGADAVIMGEREIARGMVDHAFGQDLYPALP
jgi:CPA2 family monovalent cation:H+ antiporter-2